MMRRILHPLLIVLAFVASAIAWPRLPDQVPVHWNLQGEVDRYGSRFEGAILMPALMAIIWILLRTLPKVDPKRANYARMESTYEFVITLTLAAMLALHLALLGSSLGYPVPIDTIMPLVVGVLLLGMGNVLPRAKPNWWFGVRTPWTLTNERVWVRTHRVAGYALMFAGLVFVAAAFLPAAPVRLVLIALAILAALFPIVYSYVAWRQETSAR